MQKGELEIRVYRGGTYIKLPLQFELVEEDWGWDYKAARSLPAAVEDRVVIVGGRSVDVHRLIDFISEKVKAWREALKELVKRNSVLENEYQLAAMKSMVEELCYLQPDATVEVVLTKDSHTIQTLLRIPLQFIHQ